MACSSRCSASNSTRSVLATAAYLIGVRRKEYEGEIELWQEQLGRLEE